MSEESTKTTEQNGKSQPQEPRRPMTDRDPVTTSHEVNLGDRTLTYNVTFGALPIYDEHGQELEAHIYFTAYTLGGPEGDPNRPLTFTFNGGPGSSSIWLHLGGLGPKRVDLLDDGDVPAPPYRLVPNNETWLDFTDMVFIDPVGTGFSRAVKPDLDKKFWNPKGDFQSLGEAIRLYLSRYRRWTSPLFLCGESYGTFRAAGLADHLFDRGIPLNGISLVSTILNMQTARFIKGNDLPHVLFLPSYTAAAWFHEALPKDLQAKPLREVLDEVEAFAAGEYATALMKGDELSGRELTTVRRRLARYTGLSDTYVDGTNLRVVIHKYCKEVLRDRRQTIGRIDARFTGRDQLAIGETPDFDPSLSYPGPPYTSVYNAYVRNELGWETDQEFETMSRTVGMSWQYDPGEFPDTSEALRSAMHKSRHMKVLNLAGYYDFATPYFAAEYTFNHMGLAPEFRDNIEYAYYEAGHMMYIDRASREKLLADAASWYKRALGGA